MELEQNEQELYREATRIWGDKAQMIMTMEECGELIKAVAKVFRKGQIDEVIDELVDVQIMVNQMRVLFDPTGEKFNDRFTYKLNRLRDRVGRHT